MCADSGSWGGEVDRSCSLFVQSLPQLLRRWRIEIRPTITFSDDPLDESKDEDVMACREAADAYKTTSSTDVDIHEIIAERIHGTCKRLQLAPFKSASSDDWVRLHDMIRAHEEKAPPRLKMRAREIVDGLLGYAATAGHDVGTSNPWKPFSCLTARSALRVQPGVVPHATVHHLSCAQCHTVAVRCHGSSAQRPAQPVTDMQWHVGGCVGGPNHW